MISYIVSWIKTFPFSISCSRCFFSSPILFISVYKLNVELCFHLGSPFRPIVFDPARCISDFCTLRNFCRTQNRFFYSLYCFTFLYQWKLEYVLYVRMYRFHHAHQYIEPHTEQTSFFIMSTIWILWLWRFAWRFGE